MLGKKFVVTSIIGIASTGAAGVFHNRKAPRRTKSPCRHSAASSRAPQITASVTAPPIAAACSGTYRYFFNAHNGVEGELRLFAEYAELRPLRAGGTGSEELFP